MELENIKNILSENGIKPSLHRIKIFEYLTNIKNHPTVDTIYKEISPDIPTLSKTTVYNTLKTFQECGIVQGLTIEENEVRYDETVSKHAHFKCTCCGKLFDIPVNSKALNLKSFDGHIIFESQLYYKGICKDCQNS